ncbi:MULTISPECIES: hypothetical protein [Actinomadura]|nr:MULTISPECIES: hypothetical protein [Actinomadura]
MTSPVPDVLAPARLGPVTLRDRSVKAATRGAPSAESARGSVRG